MYGKQAADRKSFKIDGGLSMKKISKTRVNMKEITSDEVGKLTHAVQRKAGLLWGYQERVNGKELYYMFPEHFKAVFAKDLELPRALKLLIERGWLEPNEDNGHLHTKTINGMRLSFYVINQSIFN
jgi:hypothetical protein